MCQTMTFLMNKKETLFCHILLLEIIYDYINNKDKYIYIYNLSRPYFYIQMIKTSQFYEITASKKNIKYGDHSL